MIIVPILPHAEFGRDDHREYALHFIIELTAEFSKNTDSNRIWVGHPWESISWTIFSFCMSSNKGSSSLINVSIFAL